MTGSVHSGNSNEGAANNSGLLNMRQQRPGRLLDENGDSKRIEGISFKIERVPSTATMSRISHQLPFNSELSLKSSISGESRTSFLNSKLVQEISQKKDLEWILALISDLQKASEKDFALPLLAYITNQLEKGKSKLYPKEFRDLYINKIYSYQDFGRVSARASI